MFIRNLNVILCLLCFCGMSAAEVIPISTIEELQKIGNEAEYPVDGEYVLTQDIDAGVTAGWNDGAGFAPIGEYNYFSQSTSFRGVLDGQGHVILGLVINRPEMDFVGLFSYVGTNGTVKNLGIRGGTITGRYRVGALCGSNDGGIYTDCFVNVSVSGASLVGGLIGSSGYGSISRCHGTGEVNGTERFVGGLLGRNGEGALNSILLDCFSRVFVAGGYEYVGGLAGVNNSIIGDSFVAGVMTVETGAQSIGGFAGENNGLITASYWDRDISGQSQSAGGEGRTTIEMLNPHAENTYVGWNFTETWTEDMEEALNKGYPYLQATPPAPCHTADINEDFLLVMSEAIAYVSDWQYGLSPMSYAIRAVYLWQKGAYYTYLGGAPPLCWDRLPL